MAFNAPLVVFKCTSCEQMLEYIPYILLVCIVKLTKMHCEYYTLG